MTQALEQVALDQLLASTQDGVFVLDRAQRFVYFNPGCERLTGYPAGEVLGSGQPCWEITECRDEQGRVLANTLCPARAVLAGEQVAARQLLRIRAKDGQARWVETLFAPLRDPAGQLSHVIGVMRDVSEAKGRDDERERTIEGLRQTVERLMRQTRDRYGFVSILSRSPAMRLVLDKARSACGHGSPILVCGQRGTGKEMIARTIHYNGLQKDGPFVAFNAAAIPRDRMELEVFGGNHDGRDYPGFCRTADGGTLYVAGVDELPETVQVGLLRVIQDREVRPVGTPAPAPVQVRIIAATERSLEDLFASNRLRDELLYRLSVVSIELPPLKHRKEDIPLLVERFIAALNQQSTRQVREIAPEVWERLEAHDWPGNAQELQSVIEAAFAAGDSPVLRAEEVTIPLVGRGAGPGRDGQTVALDSVLADAERQAIRLALRNAGGGRSLAARRLGISRSRLYRRMDALGIDPKSTKP